MSTFRCLLMPFGSLLTEQVGVWEELVLQEGLEVSELKLWRQIPEGEEECLSVLHHCRQFYTPPSSRLSPSSSFLLSRHRKFEDPNASN